MANFLDASSLSKFLSRLPDVPKPARNRPATQAPEYPGHTNNPSANENLRPSPNSSFNGNLPHSQKSSSNENLPPQRNTSSNVNKLDPSSSKLGESLYSSPDNMPDPNTGLNESKWASSSPKLRYHVMAGTSISQRYAETGKLSRMEWKLMQQERIQQQIRRNQAAQQNELPTFSPASTPTTTPYDQKAQDVDSPRTKPNALSSTSSTIIPMDTSFDLSVFEAPPSTSRIHDVADTNASKNLVNALVMLDIDTGKKDNSDYDMATARTLTSASKTSQRPTYTSDQLLRYQKPVQLPSSSTGDSGVGSAMNVPKTIHEAMIVSEGTSSTNLVTAAQSTPDEATSPVSKPSKRVKSSAVRLVTQEATKDAASFNGSSPTDLQTRVSSVTEKDVLPQSKNLEGNDVEAAHVAAQQPDVCNSGIKSKEAASSGRDSVAEQVALASAEKIKLAATTVPRMLGWPEAAVRAAHSSDSNMPRSLEQAATTVAQSIEDATNPTASRRVKVSDTVTHDAKYDPKPSTAPMQASSVELPPVHQDPQNLLYFDRWTKPDARARAAAVPRTLIFRNLPLGSSVKTIAGLVYGATIEHIRHQAGQSWGSVLFLNGDECKDFYDATANGIDWKGTSHIVWVERGTENNPINGKEQDMINKGWTRVVRAFGVKDTCTLTTLHEVAKEKGKDLVFEHIGGGRSEKGARFAEWRFASIADAMIFKYDLSRDLEWEHCNVKNAPDPCSSSKTHDFVRGT